MLVDPQIEAHSEAKRTWPGSTRAKLSQMQIDDAENDSDVDMNVADDVLTDRDKRRMMRFARRVRETADKA